jgi:hypothetical protein
MGEYSLEPEQASNQDAINQLEVNIGRPLILGAWYEGFKEWLETTAPENSEVKWWKTPGVVYTVGSKLSENGLLVSDGEGGRAPEDQLINIVDAVTEDRLGSEATENHAIQIRKMFIGLSRNDPRVLEVLLQGSSGNRRYPQSLLISRERHVMNDALGFESSMRLTENFQAHIADIAFLGYSIGELPRITSKLPKSLLPKPAGVEPIGVVRQDLSYLLA